MKKSTVTSDAKKAAQKDAEDHSYLAFREFTVRGKGTLISIGLLGPYTIVGYEEVVVFTEVRRSDSSLLIPSGGDRFQALSNAVETCRLQLSMLLSEFRNDLLEKTGELYIGYDIPRNPIGRPIELWDT